MCSSWQNILVEEKVAFPKEVVFKARGNFFENTTFPSRRIYPSLWCGKRCVPHGKKFSPRKRLCKLRRLSLGPRDIILKNATSPQGESSSRRIYLSPQHGKRCVPYGKKSLPRRRQHSLGTSFPRTQPLPEENIPIPNGGKDVFLGVGNPYEGKGYIPQGGCLQGSGTLFSRMEPVPEEIFRLGRVFHGVIITLRI